jgi:hypothetical protein
MSGALVVLKWLQCQRVIASLQNAGFVRIQFAAVDYLLPGIVGHIRMAKQPHHSNKLCRFFHGHIEVCITARFHHDITTRQQVLFQKGGIILKQLLIDRLIKGFAVFELVNRTTTGSDNE